MSTLALTTSLYATWLHPATHPEAINPNGDDNPTWSWALSVERPRDPEAQQAAGWLCGVDGESVQLVNFAYGSFALYRLLDECRRDVADGVPNEAAEALLRRLGQHYGPGNIRMCGAYVLITAETVL